MTGMRGALGLQWNARLALILDEPETFTHYHPIVKVNYGLCRIYSCSEYRCITFIPSGY